MTKHLNALLAVLICIPTFLFAQIPPSCEPPGIVTPAENCQSACIACSFSEYFGTTAGWQGDPPPPGFCSDIQNDQWIGFVASSTSATFTITPSNCSQGYGVQAAVYPAGCTENPLACNPGCASCGDVPTIFSISGMIIGNNYYLVIDGYSQDQCDIAVNVTPAQNAMPIGATPQISGTNTVCPGAVYNYAVASVPGAGLYTWESSLPGVKFNGLAGPVTLGAGGNAVAVTVPGNVNNTQMSICVTPLSSCFAGTTKCKTISISPTQTTTIPPVHICAEDAPYTLPWGVVADTSGTYSIGYTNASGCDSLVSQTVFIAPPIVTNITRAVCLGEFVAICDTTFATNGNFSRICTSFQGCDSLVNLTLVVLSPVAAIINPDTLLSCSLQQLTLHSAPSPGDKEWKDLTTGMLSSGDSLVVNHAGWYALQTTSAGNGVVCQVSDTIFVGVDSINASPSAIATVSGPINCIAPAILTGSSIFPTISYLWAGPMGFTADTNVVVVTVPGIYTFTATGLNCTNTIAVTVLINPPLVTNLSHVICQGESVIVCGNPYTSTGSYSNICTSYLGCDSLVNLNLLVVTPVASIIHPDTLLSCNLQQLVLHSESSAGVKKWIDVTTGIAASGDSLVVNHAGWYFLQTTLGSNGISCQVSDTVYIGLDSINAIPLLTATVSGPVTCIGPAILSGNSLPSSLEYSWTGPQGFTAETNMVPATIPGIYSFSAVGPNCSNTVEVTVLGSFDSGVSGISATAITCNGPGVITANTTLPNITFIWTSPAGPTLTTQTITTTTPGTYTLLATNPANGCTYTGSVAVPQNIAVPLLVFAVTHSPIGQSIGAIDLTPLNGTPPFTYSWTHNGVVIANTEDLTNLEPGLYTAVVTGSNGCTTTVTIQVMGTVAVQEASDVAMWQISPNPTSGIIQLYWKGDIAAPESNISCFDMAGRLMQKAQFNAGQSLLTIDGSSFSQGSYLLDVTPSGNGPKTILRFEIVR